MISHSVKDNLEDILQEVMDYILATYGEHYGNGAMQMIDVWEKNGSLTTTARDIAMKHLDRFGKKEGLNKKDLLKAIHFLLIMLQKEFPQKPLAS